VVESKACSNIFQFKLLDYFSLSISFKRSDQLTMGYFDNFDNKSLNKYKKNLKNGKKIIDMFVYL
jgi:hypothetical protein